MSTSTLSFLSAGFCCGCLPAPGLNTGSDSPASGSAPGVPYCSSGKWRLVLFSVKEVSDILPFKE